MRNKLFLKFLPVFLLALGVVAGLLIAWLQPPDTHPTNLIWAADKEVSVPADLYESLRNKHDCKGYRGTNGPEGVGLWGVYQTSQNKFAKIAYGCSTDLTYYIVAVKEGGSWSLLQPTEYFADNLPRCEMIDKYNIPKSFESFCRETSGQARENQKR